MNKRGKGEKIIALPWMICLFISALGVIYIVSIFYVAPYDIREIETRLLLNKVADCISYAGKINPSLISNEGIDTNYKEFLEGCYLNFNSEWENEQYFVNVQIYDSSSNSLLIELNKGNEELAYDCNLQKQAEYRLSSKCYEDSFNSFNSKNKEYTIKILTAVSKLEKNVKE